VSAIVDTPPPLVRLRFETEFLVQFDEPPMGRRTAGEASVSQLPEQPHDGGTASREYLEQVVQFCHRHDILLVYDKAYSELTFDGYVPPSVLEIDGAREIAVEFHSLSKTYNMTGWRVGWVAGGERAISALAKVKSFAGTGFPLTIQHAAMVVLRGHVDWLAQNLCHPCRQARRGCGQPARP
jgi:LL-diaminopimelate aminotransferase